MTGPLLPHFSPAGLQSVDVPPAPVRCPASFDETNDGGLSHRCNREAGHEGVHGDGRGALWVDREGWQR